MDWGGQKDCRCVVSKYLKDKEKRFREEEIERMNIL